MRPRLLARIGPPHVPITVITAPAGYGKSTLIAQWATQVSQPVIWVALDAAKNSLPVFWTTVMQAARLAPADLPAIADDPVGTPTAFLAWLRAISEHGERLTIVFDDLHAIVSEDVFTDLDGVLRALPPGISIVIGSRTSVPIALRRLRAAGQVRTLGVDDLAFTPEEITSVVNDVAPSRLTPMQIATLGTRTEGWIAGIRLAIASLEHVDARTIDSLVDSWSTSRWLDDYVVEEVLSKLPAETRQFVEQTAMLGELTADLCDHVLGISTSATILQDVVARLVFVRSTTFERDTLRYHALFAESVNRIAARHQSPADVHARQLRATEWFIAHENREAAIDHAIAADAWDLAFAEMHALTVTLGGGQHWHSLLYWLRRFPQELIIADPEVVRMEIKALQLTGQLREAHQRFTQIEERWRVSDNPLDRGDHDLVLMLHTMMNGDLASALRLGYSALHHYPLNAHQDRLRAWTGLANLKFVRGDDDLVRIADMQIQQIRAVVPPNLPWWTIVVDPERANRLALRGNLPEAATLYRRLINSTPAHLAPRVGRTRVQLASIVLEQNDLAEADVLVDQLLDDLTSVSIQVWHVEALLTIAELQSALGRPDAVEETLTRAWDAYTVHGGEHNLHRLQATEVAFWMDTNRMGLVRDWRQHVDPATYSARRLFGDPDPRVVWIHAMLADGNVTPVIPYLDALVTRSIAARRWAEIVPLTVWQAIAHDLHAGHDANVEIAQALDLALTYGRRGGFVRSFHTPGHHLGRLITRVQSQLQPDNVAYVETLTAQHIVTFEESPRPHEEIAFTKRERDVLALFPLGLTRLEMGQRLFVSESTIKKHIGSILFKLGATNRTTAIIRARELGLLPDRQR